MRRVRILTKCKKMKRTEKLKRVFCALRSDQMSWRILPAIGNTKASRSTELNADLVDLIPIVSLLFKKRAIPASKELSHIHSLKVSSLFLD